jgi:hypothetical protein
MPGPCTKKEELPAFERYFQASKEELVDLYNLTNRPTIDQPKLGIKNDSTDLFYLKTYGREERI